jgi:hypothetical protein
MRAKARVVENGKLNMKFFRRRYGFCFDAMGEREAYAVKGILVDCYTMIHLSQLFLLKGNFQDIFVDDFSS